MTTDPLNRLVEAAELPPELLFEWNQMVSYAPCTGEGSDLALLPGLNQAMARRFSLRTFDPATDSSSSYVVAAFLDMEGEPGFEELRNYLKTPSLVANTADGDVLAAILLLNALLAGHLETATRVYLDFLASVEPNDVDETTRALLPLMRARMASALLLEAVTEANLASGMELLQEAGELDPELYFSLVTCILRWSVDLPDPELLGGPWARAGAEETSPEQPAEAEFGSCEALLGDTQAMRGAFDHYQGLILQQPHRHDELRSEALDYIGSHAGQAIQPISLSFMVTGISTREILKFVADLGNFNLALEESLDFGSVAISAVNLPIGLVLSEVLEVQGLNARCAGRTIRVDASPGRADPATHLPRVILTFILSIEPPELAQKAGEGSINWTPNILTMRYHGQIEAGRAAGKGQLMWDGTDNRVEGYFDGVYLEGDVQIQFPGTREFVGRFERGLAHGPGRLTEGSQGVVQEGRFIHGRFSGIGQHQLDKFVYSEAIVYSGPIVESRPHGQGQCIGTRLTFNCEFNHGQLVALAGAPVPRSAKFGDTHCLDSLDDPRHRLAAASASQTCND